MVPADAQQRPDSLDLARMSEGEIAAEIAQRMQAFRRTHNLPPDRPIYERPIYERPIYEQSAAKAPSRAAPPPAPSAAEMPDPDAEGADAHAAPSAASPAESSPPEHRAPEQRPKEPWLRSDFSTDFSRIIAERGAAPAATTTATAPKLEIPPDLRRIPAAAAKRQGAESSRAKGSNAKGRAEPQETARRARVAGPSTTGKVLKRAAILAVLGAVLWVAWPKPGGDAPMRPAALTPNLQALEDAADALAGAPAAAPETPAVAEPLPPEPTAPASTVPELTTAAPTATDVPTAGAPEQTARRIAPDVAPAADAIAAPAADAAPQPAPPSLAPIAAQSEAVAPAPIRKPESEPYAPEPYTPEPFTPVARPFVPADSDAARAAKPLTLKPGPYTPTAKPFAPADPLFQPKPKPFVPTGSAAN